MVHFASMEKAKRIRITYDISTVLGVRTVLYYKNINVYKKKLLLILDFEEQNLIALIFNDSVYYIAYKDIEPMTELLSAVCSFQISTVHRKKVTRCLFFSLVRVPLWQTS